MEPDRIGERVGLRFTALSRRPELRHLFTTRGPAGGGNLALGGGRDRGAALAERRFWSGELGVAVEDWVVPGLVHGAGVAVVDARHRGRGATDPGGALAAVDVLLTSVPGVPLYMPVADCAAVLLLAPGAAPALALAHAGWRGLAAGVLGAAAAALEELSGRPAADFLAGISPCIGPAHFEVGEEVSALAPAGRRERRNGRWHVDLAGWAGDQLAAAGLARSRVETAGLDTAGDLRFFSHRRDGPSAGRMALLAVLNG